MATAAPAPEAEAGEEEPKKKKPIVKIIIKQEPRSIETISPDKKITNQDTEKMVNSTLQNIENKELEATLKKLAEDIFGK